MSSERELVLPGGGGDDAPDLARGSVQFVGTATVILRLAGFTILTDPNFLHSGDHVHLGYGLTARRRTNPAIELEELPPIDFVVLSHMHADHFDRIVAEKLDKALPILTTWHAASRLKGMGFQQARALKTWETETVVKGRARVRITSLPGTHAPGVLGGLLPPVMGSLIEFENGRGEPAFRVYITGDTLLFDKIAEIPLRFPEIDLALLHLGGTRLLGVLMVTMNPKQGAEMIRITKPKTAIPIHYDDYTVFKSALADTPHPPADDPEGLWKGTHITTFDEFIRMANEANPDTHVQILHRGETYDFEIPESRR